MSAAPNVNDMAKKFWDLWQDQVAKLMNDKDFVQTLLEMMQKSPFAPQNINKQDNIYAQPFTHTPSTGGNAAASHAVMAAMDECTKRLGAMERRLELLEAALIHATGKPRSATQPPRKRAAKPGTAKRAKK